MPRLSAPGSFPWLTTQKRLACDPPLPGNLVASSESTSFVGPPNWPNVLSMTFMRSLRNRDLMAPNNRPPPYDRLGRICRWSLKLSYRPSYSD